MAGSSGKRARGCAAAVFAVAAGLLTGALPVGLAAAGGLDNVKPGNKYSGLTSQGSICDTSRAEPCKVTLKTNRSGKRAKITASAFSAPCDNGVNNVRNSLSTPNSVKIKSNGTLKLLLVNDGGGTASDGRTYTAHNEMKFNARFLHPGKKYKVKGSLDVTTNLTFSDGASTLCRSGEAAFTLR